MTHPRDEDLTWRPAETPTVRRPAEAGDPSTPAPEATIPRPPGGATPEPPAAAPDRALGPYQLVQVLGRGGMGVVYKAWHPGLKSYFAVKVLLAGADASADDVKRFYREAQTSARLKHPGIVAVHDVGEHEGKTWFAMEYVEGAGLDRVLADPVAHGLAPAVGGTAAPGMAPGLNTATALSMAQEIAEAVHAAHESGVIHRDLKPQNVLRDRSGRLKVTDFGLAKVVDAAATGATRTGTLMGTPAYMSPEQAAGRVSQVDARSDVYQVGAILYEMLTGRPPYTGTSGMEVVLAVTATEPPAPRRISPRIERQAETICLKAMAREPAKRYASARALAEDCARARAGEAILARPEAWWEKGARWAKRRKLAVGLAGGIVLLLAVVGASKWETERIRRERDALQRKALDQASEAVLAYEDTVMKVRLDAAGRRALARQPLGTLEMLLEHQPDFGPLYSWRGMTKQLIGGTAQDLAEAEADLDRGCTLSPECASVWFLRGMHHLEIYGRARGLPGIVVKANDVEFAPPAPESAEELRRREQGLADLGRMMGEAERDPAFGDEGARLGQASAALHRGAEGDCGRVLELLAGQERPAATKRKGQALYFLKRFDESAAMLERTLTEWPEDVAAWDFLGLSEHAAALRSSARGADPREGFAKALADLDEALRRDPEFATAYNDRGLVYQDLGEAEAARGLDPRATYGKALADFGETLRRNPEHARAYNNRGNLYASLGAVEAARGLDPRATYGKALADLDEALRRDPEYAAAYNNRALVYQGLGAAEASRGLDPRATYGKALTDLDEALRRSPEYADAYNNRGNVYVELGQAEASRGLDPRATYGKALADLGEALRRSSEYAEAYNNRGSVYASLGAAETARGLDPRATYDRALADFGEALRRNPRLAQGYNNRGRVYAHLGAVEAARGLDPRATYGKAVADYGEALQCNPGYAEAWLNRGGCFLGLGEAEATRGIDPRATYDKAVADFGEALVRNPEYALAYNLRGSANQRLGEAEAALGLDPRARYDQAVVDYGEALLRKPEDPFSYQNRGSIYLRLGEAEAAGGLDPRATFGKALADFGEALRRDPELALAYNSRGSLYGRLGEMEAVGGRDPRARYDQAMTDFGEALRCDPEFAEAYNNRGRVYVLLGEAESARGLDPQDSFRNAEADYRAALDHHHAPAHLNLGILYRNRGRFDDAVAAFEAGARALPAYAAWAQARIVETRALQRPAPAEPWVHEFALANQAMQGGDYPAARTRYERGLALLDESLRSLPDTDRAARRAAAPLRAFLAGAHYNLACVHALASDGRDGPRAASRPLPPDEAALLRDQAFRHLEAAIESGEFGREQLESDTDLQPLHSDPRWGGLVEKVR